MNAIERSEKPEMRRGIVRGACAIGVGIWMTLAASWSTAAPGEPIILWPNGAPGALGKESDDVPKITPYLPEKAKATGAAIVVCPGGGYHGLAPHEGGPIAEWLNSIGVTAFVLQYRLAPKYHHPSMLNDAQRAIRTVRARGAEWGVDPARIGILGFSAGGHLTATAGTHYDAGNPAATDPIDRVSSRPDAMILIYPVISMGEFGHAGSRKGLIGENPSQADIDLLSNEKQVTKDTPPAFLVHSVEDNGVPYENSLLFVQALRKAGVPHEFHLFEKGPHGFGLGEKDPALAMWPALCGHWLAVHKFAKR